MKKIIKTSKTSRIAKEVEAYAGKVGSRKRKPIDVDMLVPTPCVPFNLECSGHVEGAFQLGKFANLIGDSHAGKTLFALSIFAECSIRERFDDYRFIYDDVEAACEFDIEYLFGENCSERVETDIQSNTIEEFSDNIARLVEEGTPFIYVLDSFDALTSEDAIELDVENRRKREKGKETKGSYGDGKPRKASDFFKLRKQEIKNTNSFVLIISQTRDNLGFGAMFTPKTRSGGKALKFYSFHEIWLSMEKKEKKGSRTVVTNVQAKITKNKLTGRHGVVHFPILFDYGVDNITACINFLFIEKHWSGKRDGINTKGFHPKKSVPYTELVEYIEDNDMEDELAKLCKDVYDHVIESITPKNRKFRYNRA